MSNKIPVLFVHSKSNYKHLSSFDCYDEKRNALTYLGTSPVIAHPPCRLFSRLRKFSTADLSEKQLAYWAVDLVRKNGGVLEHPFGSTLWNEKSLPSPGCFDVFGGITIIVNQSSFGFPCQKKTLLYIVGLSYSEIPPVPPGYFPPSKIFHNLTPKQRSETTVSFALYLGTIVNLIKSKKYD